MSDAASIVSLKKALNGAVTAGKVEETKAILEQLKSQVRATEELLRETKIGLTVGKLRSNADKQVSALARELVKKWKEEVGSRSGASSSGAGQPQVKTEKAAASASNADSPSTSTKPSPSPVPASAPSTSKPPLVSNGSSSTSIPKVKPEPGTAIASASAAAASKTGATTLRSSKTDKVDCSTITDDKTRNKCIELVYDSLAMDSDAESDLILQRSRDIESSTYSNISDVSAYRAKMRSLYLNLKDKSNPVLRASVISGEIDGKLLWSMSSADMASAEKKAQLAEFSKAALFSAQGAAPKKAETDMFECGKCKKRKATYYQMQTRSADEPMTTFVTCLNCGNNWRFS